VDRGTARAVRGRDSDLVVVEDRAARELAVVVRVEVAEALALQVAAVAAPACGIPECRVAVVAQGQALVAPV
jgi:hypothetical protein